MQRAELDRRAGTAPAAGQPLRARRPPPPLGRVLVTGGASGLGAAIVEAVAARRGTPIVLDRQPPRDTDGVDFEQVDLADARAAERAVARAIERHGGLDAVVTAAGTDACGKLEDVAGEDWDRVVAVNLLGTAAIVRAALPALQRADNGRVVTVASTLGLRVLTDATVTTRPFSAPPARGGAARTTRPCRAGHLDDAVQSAPATSLQLPAGVVPAAATSASRPPWRWWRARPRARRRARGQVDRLALAAWRRRLLAVEDDRRAVGARERRATARRAAAPRSRPRPRASRGAACSAGPAAAERPPACWCELNWLPRLLPPRSVGWSNDRPGRAPRPCGRPIARARPPGQRRDA